MAGERDRSTIERAVLAAAERKHYMHRNKAVVQRPAMSGFRVREAAAGAAVASSLHVTARRSRDDHAGAASAYAETAARQPEGSVARGARPTSPLERLRQPRLRIGRRSFSQEQGASRKISGPASPARRQPPPRGSAYVRLGVPIGRRVREALGRACHRDCRARSTPLRLRTGRRPSVADRRMSRVRSRRRETRANLLGRRRQRLLGLVLRRPLGTCPESRTKILQLHRGEKQSVKSLRCG